MRLLFALVLIASAVTACHSQPTNRAAHDAILAQWSGHQGGGSTPATRVIRTAEEWAAVWRQLDREPPRSLDTTHESAVLIGVGERRTGGFKVELLGIRTQDGKRVIEYQETVPEPGMILTQALTSPWVVAVIPRADLPLVFHKASRRASDPERK